MRKILTFLLLLFSLSTVIASPLSSDEEVIFFPSSATISETGRWIFPIHHWVYEPEKNTFARRLGRKAIAESLELAGLSDADTSSDNFKARLKWFLVDNKGSKNLSLKLSKINPIEGAFLNTTAANGHATTDIYIPFRKELRTRSWVKIEVDGFTANNRKFYGEVQLIPSTGLSIISDIDDTIKISEVLDTKKLLKNVFVKPYVITSGMPELYQQLKEKGAYFHYVSSSPWQIYPSLKDFMERYYPKGTIVLRYLRLKDSSFLSFLRSSQEYKIEKVAAIVKRYPKHRFILIGDSGEHDPEIYAKIYQQFPANIKSIWIRYVAGSDVSKTRLDISFKDIPTKVWTIFKTPNKLIIK
ncbi:MAG TPA: DUF2183 domain-containing protein [Leucothrix mucor]|nr:DUF2183 domain-containing protein [Leucothrix mucor]